MTESFVDFLLPFLSESELKVLLFITRSTWGFQKSSDSIAISQFRQGRITKVGKVLCRGTGLSNEAIQKAIYVLERLKIISVEKELGCITIYRLNYEFPVADFNKKHFDAARWFYSTRERKFDVSLTRKATFLKNRTFTSIGLVATDLVTRNTISTVTPDTFLKNTTVDTNGTNVPLQASPDIQKKEKSELKEIKNAKTDMELKNLFIEQFVAFGLSQTVAECHIQKTSEGDLQKQVKACQEASPKLRQAYIESWQAQYTKNN